MATLKICTYNKTHWIAGVTSLIEARSFSVPEEIQYPPEPRTSDEQDAAGKTHDAAVIAACGPVEDRVVHLADFRFPNRDHAGVGKLLYVKTKDGSDEAWIVPAGSSYLMEDGKTVDRI